MSKMKSFRAKIDNDAIDQISLHTNNGSVGYSMKKVDVVYTAPGV